MEYTMTVEKYVWEEIKQKEEENFKILKQDFRILCNAMSSTNFDTICEKLMTMYQNKSTELKKEFISIIHSKACTDVKSCSMFSKIIYSMKCPISKENIIKNC
jgi:hypothetical protein